jgi:hypothetical protein
MRLVITAIHAAPTGGALNSEWFVVENASDRPFSTAGCTVAVGKGKGRLRGVGTLDPGFTLAPRERVRVITGNPGKKAHGPPPEATADLKDYHLFLAEPLLAGPGTVVSLSLKQHELARAAYDAAGVDGVAPDAEKESRP